MRKVSYYLFIVVGLSAAFVSFWVYQRYFKKEAPNFLVFPVERGTLRELVKVRGEVAAEKDFDLGFQYSGTIERIFVNEGELVKSGAVLMSLGIRDFEIELAGLEAKLAQKKAALNKLLAGATKEDIQVAEIKVENAKVSIEEAKKNLIDKLQDAYTKSDDAVRNKVDQFFVNPRSSSPQINLNVDVNLKGSLEFNRLLLESVFINWRNSLDALNLTSDLDSYLSLSKVNLSKIKTFLDDVAYAINGLTAGGSLTQTLLDTYKSDVSTARTNVNTATVNLSAAEEKLKTAKSSLALAENELVFKKAGAREEDVEIARADIKQTESDIAAVREKIQKSTLYAPAAAKVVKVNFEKGESFTAGEVAVSLATSDYKIRADVSELDIGKLRGGKSVAIRFDALPDRDYGGKIVSIEPKEIIKDGDKYYRINIALEKQDEAIRSGMNVDLAIGISSKEDILKIPEIAVYQKNGGRFVRVSENGIMKEARVETGISDGQSVEIISGLKEGQKVAVFTD